MRCNDCDIPWLGIWVGEGNILLYGEVELGFLAVGRRAGILADVGAGHGVGDDAEVGGGHS